MIILGIDPGVGRIGWGVVEKLHGKVNLVDYGCIQTVVKSPVEERLVTINKELTKIIKKYNPKIAAVEKLFFNTNVTTAIDVGEARGVIILTLQLMKVPQKSFTPLQVKQSIAGYGRADKSQVQKMVKALLHLNDVPKPDDAADALALALMI